MDHVYAWMNGKLVINMIKVAKSSTFLVGGHYKNIIVSPLYLIFYETIIGINVCGGRLHAL